MANCRPVRCVETGEVFESIAAAAERIGMYQSSVSKAVRGKTETAGGYHWEYEPKEDVVTYDPPKPTKKRHRPIKTIEEVQKEAARRSKETGRNIRYAHIQIEETLQMYGGWKLSHHCKKKRTKEGR